MTCQNSSNAEELAIASALVAAAVARNLNADQINVLGNFLAAVAASLLVIAAQLASEQSQGEAEQQGRNNKSNKNNRYDKDKNTK
jgi:hypothetical protein